MQVEPFSCLRPASERAAEFQSLPYDLYDRESACAQVARRPRSFLAIDRPETGFPPEQDMYALQVYAAGAALLQNRIADGTLQLDPDACYYVYLLDEVAAEAGAQVGIVGLCSIDEYENGTIKRHENTRATKERDRIEHIKALGAQTGPIFLAYRDSASIDALVARAMETPALYDFVDEEGVRQAVWRIAEEADVQALRAAFSQIAGAYIADGHHRAASAVKVGLAARAEAQQAGTYTGAEDFNRFLAVLFPAQQLRILAYNRMIKELNGLTVEEFLDKLSASFDVEPAAGAFEPAQKGTIALYAEGRWYALRLKPALRSSHPVEGLDVSVLHEYIMKPLLGVEDARTDWRLEFVGAKNGLSDLVALTDAATPEPGRGPAVAFALCPLNIEELMAVADAGLLMPPKSTWFEPKLRSGLFIHQI